ncbi:MAG: hypothetical protein PVI71_18595 [Desulfobacterales bacterium]|jgi:hypothetical protein
MKFFKEKYVKDVEKANKKNLTWLPELYIDSYDSASGEIKSRKLPRRGSPAIFTEIISKEKKNNYLSKSLARHCYRDENSGRYASRILNDA